MQLRFGNLPVDVLGILVEVSMNIKSEEAHRLARELAQLTGESLTAAVRESVRERRDRLLAEQAGSLADRLLEIGSSTAPRLSPEARRADHGELLYDEAGLPR